jgi:hypothetical protein
MAGILQVEDYLSSLGFNINMSIKPDPTKQIKININLILLVQFLRIWVE